MGKALSAATRKEMPQSEFAGPGHSFPVEDKKHARLAISGATRSEHAGNISAEEAARIKAKARAKLGKKKTAGSGEEKDLAGELDRRLDRGRGRHATLNPAR